MDNITEYNIWSWGLFLEWHIESTSVTGMTPNDTLYDTVTGLNATGHHELTPDLMCQDNCIISATLTLIVYILSQSFDSFEVS